MSEEGKPKELTGPIPRPATGEIVNRTNDDFPGVTYAEADAGLMTIREAAEAFGVSPDTIRRAIKAEQKQAGTGLKAVKRPTKRGDDDAVAPKPWATSGNSRRGRGSKRPGATLRPRKWHGSWPMSARRPRLPRFGPNTPRSEPPTLSGN
jgi:hypothetical protein